MDIPNPTVLRNTFDSTNSFFFLRVTMFLPTALLRAYVNKPNITQKSSDEGLTGSKH